MGDSFLQRLAVSLVSRPAIYDLLQRLVGREKIADRLRHALNRLGGGRFLDVGSSSGGLTGRLGLSPVCLDVDLTALLASQRRGAVRRAIAADAGSLPFSERTFDVTLCVMIFHHLDETKASETVSELARVTAGHLVFLEPLRNDARPVSRWLWRYDRGRHPRTLEAIRRHLERAFRLESVTEFAVFHEYVLCVAVSKAWGDPAAQLVRVAPSEQRRSRDPDPPARGR